MKRKLAFVAIASALFAGCVFDENELLGADSDSNGVRDDYEESIEQSNLPTYVAELAITAGKAYQSLLQQSVTEEVPTKEQASDILTSLVLAEKCKRQNQAEYGVTWKESLYFNTFDRTEAKFKTQAVLLSMLEGDDISIPDGNSCEMLMNI
ncbi:hypothetical protein [Teredinibacter turnerae]|uniref:hypothetical protein n=1 Tax=Teredinibacter turnerae TaxID=2426 RepID=UPI000407D65C|nr:hypothetical protein [Teredinibacter turnerae]